MLTWTAPSVSSQKRSDRQPPQRSLRQRSRRTHQVEALGPDLTPFSWVIGIGDVRQSGRGDLLALARGTGDLYLLEATSKGFQPRRYLGDGMAGFDLAG